MKSIDKLREYVDRQQDEYNNHNVSFVWQLSTIADEIEAEIADNYMLLPVDADGVPIHLGDTVEGELALDNATVRGTVRTYHIHANDEPDTVYIKVKPSKDTWTIKELRIARCRHVKPRTLEDVIEGAINTAFGNEASVSDIAKKSADEIREMLGIMLGGDA